MSVARILIVLQTVVALVASGCGGGGNAADAGLVNPCHGETCSGHGLCATASGATLCVCNAGYHALDLACVADDVQDPCAGVTCGGAGTCAVASGSPACVCDAGYHAAGPTTCVADVDPCAGVTCSGHGVCATAGGATLCACDAGYHAAGMSCVADPDAGPPRDGGAAADDGPAANDAAAHDSGAPHDSAAPHDSGAQQDGGGTTTTGAYFPAGAPWYQDISAATVDSESAAVITGLGAAGGWGTGQMRIDFSIEVLTADASTPMRTFTTTDDFYSPDCDHVPMPVPTGGVLEGETGYECLSDGDCHLIVVHTPTQKLYEMWRANISGGTFYGGCLAVWDMTRVYPASARGDQCTSADAAGYPIAPLLFTADEVASGSVDRAIRFILPNARIRHGVFVHPATHATSAASGGAGTPPYGARLRLRADYPLASLPSDGARAVARGLQRYGMFLADGGNIALTAQSDRLSTAKWDDVLDSYALSGLHVSDFEMIEGGTRIPYTGDCVRAP